LSETHFDRSDWRPGKRRRTQPRVHDCGGQKEAPVNLLAMAKLVGLHTNRAKRVHSHCNLDRKSVSLRRDERFEPVYIAGGAGAAKKRRAPRARRRPETNWRGQRNKAVSRGNITEWVLPVRPSTISAEVIELRRLSPPR
jgi:hypothetical protein